MAEAPLNVVFLWHQHQPYYVDPVTRTAQMPWVRLHAVKGYLDMIAVCGRYPELRVNFNLTPVLVKQLRELAQGRVRDLWEEWARVPAEDLDGETRRLLLEHFFKINWGTCIEPHPRYAELLEQRGRNGQPRQFREAVRLFSDQDYRDLQVWFNLAWCGFEALRLYPELEELRRKGRHFTEEEKLRLLAIQREIVGSIPGLYRTAEEERRVELTTTPFYHPILPLIYDTDLAKRALPGRELPPRFRAPEDAAAQLRRAQEQHAEVFGRAARGLWPSEGSVAPELMPLFQEAGIEYFCTDEDILFRSLHSDPEPGGGGMDHVELFQPWTCEHGGAKVRALFRERPLSDFIGFNAARNTAADAAAYLTHHLEHLAGVAKHPHRVVCLALDGENAWEAFADGGEAFLCRMYESILKSPKLACRRLGDYFDEVRETGRLRTLHTGSWIGANFDIWIGDAEENRGWEWVGKTREFLEAHLRSHQVPAEQAALAWEEIYAAEGSDWFWWYGPDFQNDSDMLFDALFRQHLQNAYRVLGQTPPAYLEVPIRQRREAQAATVPGAFITPEISGEAGGFFDWLGAGRYETGLQQTAMFQSDRVARDLYYGFDERCFYLRVDFAGPGCDGVEWHFCKPAVVCVRLRRGRGGVVEGRVEREGKKGGAVEGTAWGRSVVAAVRLADLGLEGRGEAVAFQMRLFKGEVEVERHPERGFIECEGPSPEFRRRNWFV